MLRDEYPATVLGREHGAVVEPHPERGDVRAQLPGRRLELRAGAPIAEFRIGDVALMAERVAEVEAGARRSVELVGGHVVAQLVAAVVREPESAGLGVPVEADRVPYAGGEDLEARPVRVHPRDAGQGSL